MSTIELYNGKVQNSAGAFSIWTQVRWGGMKKDIPLFNAVKDPKSPVSEPGGIIKSEPAHKIKANAGNWTCRRIECEPSTYLKFVCRKTDYKELFGGLPTQSIFAFWIRARDTAPLRELRIELPHDSLSTYSALYITGRFDIVEPAELAEHKLYLTENEGTLQNDINQYDPRHQDGIIVDRIIEAEIAPKAKTQLKTVGGQTITKPSKVRRIRPIRRK